MAASSVQDAAAPADGVHEAAVVVATPSCLHGVAPSGSTGEPASQKRAAPEEKNEEGALQNTMQDVGDEAAEAPAGKALKKQ